MRVAVGLLSAMLLMSSVAPAHADLEDRQSEAERRQQALRDRIDGLQKEIDARESARKEAADGLKQSETAISGINRRLAELNEQSRQARADLADLDRQIAAQQKVLGARRKELADQLRAQYTSGLSPWAAMLSGDDPQQLGRNLGYLDYIVRARVNTMQALRRDLDRLTDLQARADARTAEIAKVVAETAQQKAELVVQQKARATVLARLEGQIAAQRGEADKLGRDDQRLSRLIGDLDVAIAKQAEDARRAEEARKQAAELARKQAEAARQADIARKAEEAQRLAEATRRAEAARREAELTRRQAEKATAAKSADAARRLAEARDAAAVREQADAALRRATPAPQPPEALQERTPQPRLIPQTPDRPSIAAAGRVIQSDARGSIDLAGGTPAASASLAPPPESQPARPAAPERRRQAPADDDAAAPASSGDGLKKGLQPPVRGQIQGRFGLGRPEGGVWRGIVLRAPEGTPAHAVAAGTVVYAQWLRGFGNLIIVDHGDQYMTVYAYNQSLLKQVGDNVRAGDAVALVGATGGQVESGLYFEIRHRGAPVDPAQWLAQ
jgi:septal ring factor EnvC (AmiA/AmiB activator)